MRLAAKLISIFLVAVALLTAANAYITIRAQQEAFENEQAEYATRVGKAIEGELLIAWKAQGDDAAAAVIENERPKNQFIEIRFTSFESEASRGNQPAVSKDSLASLSHGQVTSVMRNERGGTLWLHTYYAVIGDRQQKGAIEFSRPAGPIQAQCRATIFWSIVSIITMATIAVGLILVAGINLIGRPLDQLVERTRQIAAGEFSQPLILQGRDELSQLATALNEMCEQLAKNEAAIRGESAKRIAMLEQLRHADRLKTVGRLAAGIAHELGTPLNVVAGRAGLIASGKLTETENRQSAETIKSEANRITAIVRQLLDFARQNRPERKPDNLDSLVERTISLLQPLADKKGVTFARGFTERVEASIDASQIQQVLTNLMVNAIQASPTNGLVEVSTRRETMRFPENADGPFAEYASIQIQDNGAGIDEQTRDQIFEPFFTTKDVGEGTGLGLSIAFGVVREHDGWIEVDSHSGKGACFTIYLPIESVPADITHAR
ncbi:sensor histidine kinase [Bremerella alba]|uniref:histidine kinase n=1 Tax=Bremerella alba TaxID=980252 RepID=A0A7V8V1I4_9BACT|nr:ATP-binding protein [Bremerella alba]MBA2112959.1 Adaptive-response sensory-kinase SasA [Bremerella alba]